MKYTAGYDREFTCQFFIRTFNGLLEAPDFKDEPVIPEEVDYLAHRLSETAVIPQNRSLGNPWFTGSYEDLAEATKRTSDRRLLQLAELAANQLVVLEGIVASGGLWNVRGEPWRKPRFRIELAPVLYRRAAAASFRGQQESFVLRQMARNTFVWVRVLRLVKGNDLLEMLGRRPSFIVLPGE